MPLKLNNERRFGNFPTWVSKLERLLIRFSPHFFLITLIIKTMDENNLQSARLSILPVRYGFTIDVKYLQRYFENAAKICWMVLSVFILIYLLVINK